MSKMKPRFRADLAGVRMVLEVSDNDVSVNLVSLYYVPIRRNSVFDGLRASRFEILKL